ncbi:PACE efflux transporter [Microbulbifer sp. CNSA002]|uniref:PACE efflux transporter n=1 Tax=Microbulbifer sp. CNSA002 TaxID=3373604 RepID=UPI0039B53C7F
MTKSLKNRLFHAVSYEFFLLLTGGLLVVPVFDLEVHQSLVLAAGLSLFALVWNMVFNHAFDWYLLNIRKNPEKTFIVRATHALLFEGGMLVLTLPVIAWSFNLTILEAFMLEIVMVIYIVIYTYVFNYCFDKLHSSFQVTEHKR